MNKNDILMPLPDSSSADFRKEEFVGRSFPLKHSFRRDAVYVGLFFALIFGAFSFWVSLVFAVWFGDTSGIRPIEIHFNRIPKHQTWDWYGIISLILSLGLSFLIARVVFRFIKTRGRKDSLAQADRLDNSWETRFPSM